MKRMKKMWKDIGALTTFQWLVLHLLTLTLLCSIFTVAVEILLWGYMGGKK